MRISRRCVGIVLLFGGLSAFCTSFDHFSGVPDASPGHSTTGSTTQGQFFGRLYQIASPLSNEQDASFQSERSKRVSDSKPFLAEGAMYVAFTQLLKDSWSLSDLQSTYLRIRMGLENMESRAVTKGDKEFVFHAEKALMLVGFERHLFRQDQYLRIFGDLRARLQQ